MTTANWIALSAVVVGFLTLSIQQIRIFRLDKKRQRRANIKLSIFYALEQKDLIGGGIRTAMHKADKSKGFSDIEMNTALYDMLSDNVIKTVPGTEKFTRTTESDIEEKEKAADDRRIDRAFEFIDQWKNSGLKEARDLIRDIKARPDDQTWSPAELKKRIEDCEDLKRSVINMMNYFQTIYLSIYYERVNENLLRDALSETYRSVYDNLFDWFKKRTERDPTMCKHLMALKLKWFSPEQEMAESQTQKLQ